MVFILMRNNGNCEFTDKGCRKWLDQYSGILYRYSLIKVQSQATAKALLKDTSLAGIQSTHKFSGKSSVQLWLISNLKHKIRFPFRKAKKEAYFFKKDPENDLFSRQSDYYVRWK